MRKRVPKRGANMERKGVVRAVSYGRCSTVEQSEGDYSTLESQKDYVRNYIQAVHPDWEIVAFYEDGGFSGKDTNRPGLQSLLADCQMGKFDVVVTYKLDRITRSLRTSLTSTVPSSSMASASSRSRSSSIPQPRWDGLCGISL